MSTTKQTFKNLHIPELPKLSAEYLVVREDAWKVLTDYVSAQTSTINGLLDTIETLQKLQDLSKLKFEKDIRKLQLQVAELANALEGAYTDE